MSFEFPENKESEKDCKRCKGNRTIRVRPGIKFNRIVCPKCHGSGKEE